jgi:hypothetical protein
MALPKLNAMKYALNLPSNGEEVEYRPFLMSEQKMLMLAQESEDENEIQKAIAKCIEDCTFNLFSAWELPAFDVEYIFLKVRSKSVGETVELGITCPDDNETVVKKKIDLSKIECTMYVGHTNEIPITDDVKLIMKYPTLKDITMTTTSETLMLFDMIGSNIHQVIEGENIHQDVDISKQEMDEFIGSMTSTNLEDITKFFESMPKLTHEVSVKNPNTGKTGKVVLEGFQSFFA